MRRFALIAGALVLLTLLFAVSGHWVLAAILAAASVAAVWAFVQARGVH
ncbi:MAG: hypothetical protein HOQ28_17635 [Thermoleophilia bacterium]|nr:hypothetical protein [Thermoleophilia bacterium]